MIDKKKNRYEEAFLELFRWLWFQHNEKGFNYAFEWKFIIIPIAIHLTTDSTNQDYEIERKS